MCGQFNESKYLCPHKLLRNWLLRLDHIRTMEIPQEHTLDPMGDNNNHLSRREYTEDAPAAESRFKRVEIAEQDMYERRRRVSLGDMYDPSHLPIFLIWDIKGGRWLPYHSRKSVLNPTPAESYILSPRTDTESHEPV